MPADSGFPDLPPSPIRDDDKFLVNRSNVSHKIDASDLLYYFANVEFPVQKPCDGNQDCPPGQICVNGYCVERCDACYPYSDCCPEGHVCVDVNNSGADFVCIPYPFPCGTIDGENPCPDDYVCWNGMCIRLCSTNPPMPCPEGTMCFPDFIDIGAPGMPDLIDVCVPYPFPCPENNLCPDGFECFMGYCVIDCDTAVCPPGHKCIEIEVIDDVNGNKETKYVCQPIPFPCGITTEEDPITGDVLPCPPGYYCYAGMCYPICDPTDPNNGGCPPGFECTNIGNYPNNEDGNDTDNDDPPVTICLPSNPAEGLINDGKLNIIDDNNDRRTIFSANQYGDTFLKFNGIDVDGGNGGGSGTGDLTFKTLWERRDPFTRDSDIEPSYENVDVLPHGRDSNIGYDPDKKDNPEDSNDSGDRWDGVFTRDLNISRRVYGNLINFKDDWHDVGSEGLRWKGLYTHDLWIDRDVYGTLRPNEEYKWDIGELNRRWGTVYTRDFNIERDVYGTLRPSGEGLYDIGEPNRRWKNGHFGSAGSGIQLNENGSIGLPGVGDVGAENMILTSKGNGQAVWDYIHFESQDQRVFIARLGDKPGGGHAVNNGAPSGDQPPGGSEFARTGSATNVIQAILSIHATFDFTKVDYKENPDSFIAQLRVALYDMTAGKYVYSDWTSVGYQGPQRHKLNASISGSDSLNGGISGNISTITFEEARGATHHGTAAFTFIGGLDRTHEYQAVGAAFLEAGPSGKVTLYDGSVRAFFIR